MAHDIAATYDGVVRTSQLNKGGIRNDELSRLCSEGEIYRIKKGTYCTTPIEELSEERLLAEFLPDAIICMESALYIYGYSDYAPNEWTIAIPRTFSRSRLILDGINLKPRFIQESLFNLGERTDPINGTNLKIYDKERTICDCFKYRNKMDSETFNKAIVAYSKDPQKNLMKLMEYAKAMRVQKKLQEIMEVLLNG